jgi:hypothetical protein
VGSDDPPQARTNVSGPPGSVWENGGHQAFPDLLVLEPGFSGALCAPQAHVTGNLSGKEVIRATAQSLAVPVPVPTWKPPRIPSLNPNRPTVLQRARKLKRGTVA